MKGTIKSEKQIEAEIVRAENNLNTKQKSYNADLEKLTGKIKIYTGWAWTLVAGGFATAAVGIYLYNTQLTDTSASPFNLNLFGDFTAGSVSSLWSLAGLFFIYVAFLGQKQQMLHQQQELLYNQVEIKYTRLELAGQKLEMKTQNQTIAQQRFDNFFFQLLNNHNSVVNDLEVSRHGNITNGRDCFTLFFNEFRDVVKKYKFSLEIEEKEEIVVNNSYLKYFQREQTRLGHYFRNLYHVIKFIDTSDIENKKKYTSIVRAQLSTGELLMLFYNCQSELGSDNFKPLVTTYSLLNNIDTNLLLHKDHKGFYPEKAYQ